MRELARIYGRILDGCGLVAAALLLAMTSLIVADVFLRNRFNTTIPASVELTEYALFYASTFSAPWLLRRGQHIRIDVLLRVVPPRLAWYCEWLCDLVALACTLVMAFAGFKAVQSSMAIGAMVVKTLAIPEWWLLAPMQLCFLLLSVEIVFRMARLHAGPPGPREDAITVG